MGEDKYKYKVKRWIAYCPSTQRYVNHEISFVLTDEKKDVIATCTGIEDSCSNCLFLLEHQAQRGSADISRVLCDK